MNVWKNIKRLLIVISYKDDVQYNEYRKALDQALNESSVVDLKIIVLLSNSIKKETLSTHPLIHFLSHKDFGLFGKIKDDSLLQLLAQPYDTLLWFEQNESKLLSSIKQVPFINKIGFNYPNEYFTIQLSSTVINPMEIVNFVKNTLEKIE